MKAVNFIISAATSIIATATASAQSVRISCKCTSSDFKNGCSNQNTYFDIDQNEQKIKLTKSGENKIFPGREYSSGNGWYYYSIENFDDNSISLKADMTASGWGYEIYNIDRLNGAMSKIFQEPDGYTVFRRESYICKKIDPSDRAF